MGSLGQYKGETDIVEDVYIYNISMTNASDGARIKVWPGIETEFQSLLNGGGGLGRVKNGEPRHTIYVPFLSKVS